MTTPSLFDPIKISKITLKNRMVMAPMTRCRGDANHIQADIAAEYYQQRSNAGLIITEGTSPSINGDGYARVPGIYNKEQINAWKKVTKAVHDKDGKIFLQIMHVGRIAHPLNKAPNAETVAPSAVKAAGIMFTDQQGAQEMPVPRALRLDEIPSVINEYKQATINAYESGFDGVELHSANGYLPSQFLSSNTNLRTDIYGGSAENRIRFVIETLKAMIAVNGAETVGIRISPASTFNDIHDANPTETFTTLLHAIDPLNLAYVHAIRAPDPNFDAFKLIRDHYQGIHMINGGFEFASGQTAIATHQADLVSYGQHYLANPDLVKRFHRQAPLNKADENTFYTPGPKGYIDYPFLD